jgi:CHAT domain-containing protein
VLVAATGNDDGPLLDGVDMEVHTVAGLVESVSGSVINDVNVEASMRTLLDKLPEAHIFHYAGLGIQKEDPLQSCLMLNDGPVTISALMSLKLPNAMFAFLSACETARGDRSQPDEALHLAASLLFCGFRSVIGTMW